MRGRTIDNRKRRRLKPHEQAERQRKTHLADQRFQILLRLNDHEKNLVDMSLAVFRQIAGHEKATRQDFLRWVIQHWWFRKPEDI